MQIVGSIKPYYFMVFTFHCIMQYNFITSNLNLEHGKIQGIECPIIEMFQALYQYDIMNVISFWRNPVVDLQYVTYEGKKEN